jgi:hypothetical protein
MYPLRFALFLSVLGLVTAQESPEEAKDAPMVAFTEPNTGIALQVATHSGTGMKYGVALPAKIGEKSFIGYFVSLDLHFRGTFTDISSERHCGQSSLGRRNNGRHSDARQCKYTVLRKIKGY